MCISQCIGLAKRVLYDNTRSASNPPIMDLLIENTQPRAHLNRSYKDYRSINCICNNIGLIMTCLCLYNNNPRIATLSYYCPRLLPVCC